MDIKDTQEPKKPRWHSFTSSALLCVITWIDSKGVTGEWEFWDDIKPLEPHECITVGFMSDEHPDFITVCQTRTDGQILGRITIPRGAIKKMVGIENHIWEAKT